MAQKQDPMKPVNGISRDPETPRFLEGEQPSGPGSPPEAGASPKREPKPRISAYAHATPDEIAADIERTRAHMDETLSLLGQRLKPGKPGKAAFSLIGFLALAGIVYLGIAGYRGFRRRHTLRHRLIRSSRLGKLRLFQSGSAWHKAGTVDQGILAAKLALAARKGKPAIIVVEPRKV